MEDLRYVVSLDTRKFQEGMTKVGKKTKETNDTMKTFGKTLVAAFSGVAVGMFTRSVVNAAVKQEKAVTQLAQALKNQGVYTKSTMKELEGYASSLQRATTFGDEQIMQAQSLAVSFGLTGDKLKEVTKAAMDFSAAKGTDLNTTMELLGRAFAGNTQSLTRYGIVIDTTKSKSEQFSEIIKQLNQRFGGQAEMLANTYGGKLQQFSNAWGDLKETIGFAVLPTLTKVTDSLKNLFVELQHPTQALSELKNWFNQLPIWSKNVILFVGSFAAFAAAGKVFGLFTSLVRAGGAGIVSVFKALFSWPALILAGLFVLKTGWDHNWGGIRDKFGATWEKMKSIWHGAWDDLVKIWGNPKLSIGTKMFDSLKTVLNGILSTIQNIGAGITAAFGGDSKKYLDDTTKALDKIKSDLSQLVSPAPITVKLNAAVDLGKNVYSLPAKMLLSGFDAAPDFLQSATNALSAFGIIGLVSGKWRIAAGLALAGSVLTGAEWSKDKMMNQVITALNAGGATFFLTKNGTVALGVAIAITSFEIGTDIGSWFANTDIGKKFSDLLGKGLKGIPQPWIDKMNALLNSNNIVSKIAGSGMFIALELGNSFMSALKTTIDIFKVINDALTSAVTRLATVVVNFGKKIGQYIIDGIKSILAPGWLDQFFSGGHVNIKDFVGIGIPGKHASGGMIFGTGGPKDDKIPAMLSNGEYVIPAWLVKKYKWLVGIIEGIRVKGFAAGGFADGGNAGGGTNVVVGKLDLSQIAADLKDEMSTMVGAIKPYLEEIFSSLGLNIDLTGNSLADLENGLQKAANDITGVSNAADKVKNAFSVLEGAIAKSSELFSINKNNGKESFDFSNLAKSIGNAFGTMFKSGGNFFANIFSGLGKLMGPLGSIIAPMILSLRNVQAILNPITTILSAAMSVLGPLINGALQPLVTLLNMFGHTLGALFSILIKPLRLLVSIIVGFGVLIQWTMNQITLAINTALSWIGMGFLTQNQINEMQKSPEQLYNETMKSANGGGSNGEGGSSYSAGYSQPVTYNYNITFKNNDVLTEDNASVTRFANLIITYVRAHGGLKVFE